MTRGEEIPAQTPTAIRGICETWAPPATVIRAKARIHFEYIGN